MGLSLDVFKRYVDDSVQACGGIGLGWFYSKGRGKTVYSREGGRLDELPLDQRTFEVLKDIANEIDPSIQMEYDIPSLHHNGKLPVLDLEVWMEKTYVSTSE